MALTLRREYLPAFSVDPAPAALPEAPYAYYGDNLLSARAVALARGDRPTQFLIADSVYGPAPDSTTTPLDPTVLPAAVETLALLGQNTLQVQWFGDQNQYAKAAMDGWGITRYHYATTPPVHWFTWEVGPGDLEAWGAYIANWFTTILQVPLSGALFMPMDDEPGWWQRLVTDQVLANPTAITQFHAYLTAQGLTPAFFGESDWTTVLPIGFTDVDETLATHRLYYWTQRFVTTGHAEQQLANTLVLRTAVNPNILTAVNNNNWLNRWFVAATATQPNDGAAPGLHEAVINPDWFVYGHLLPLGAHWTEDWFHNTASEAWSIYAACLRSAAILNGATFGGYIVGLTLLDGHPQGGRYKALALLGRGAKALMWYVHGPGEQFPGNGWSTNALAYGQIADANRLIARAEDLLYPGQPLASAIAILLPISAQLWDLHVGSSLDSYTTANWFTEMVGFYYALTQMQHQVDFLGETDVAARLGNYQVLYVLGKNVSQAAQDAIATWIAAGGVAWFSPGSAVADEYDQPTTTLNATRGITAQALTPYYVSEDWDLETGVTILSTQIAGEALGPAGAETARRHLERLTVTTATVLAQFSDDDSAAVVAQATGSGWAISAGYQLGNQYNYTWTPVTDGLLTGWNTAWRRMLTFPARVAGVIPAVEVDTERVEPARLDSAAGIAVTLLNWTDAPLEAITVTVHACPVITRAVRAETLQAVSYTQDGTDVTVTMPLASVDVLKLYA